MALTFDPQSGHEQKGRRPALVISNTLFNQKTGLAIVCPVTNKEHSYPFHIKISSSVSLAGFVMVDQVKSVDYNSRKVKFIERSPDELLNEVLGILETRFLRLYFPRILVTGLMTISPS
ncbi:MAG: type II toxin-antitoxin system PemK/MazF family toxin [Candidatus Omnitrophica bacterium]|nr:type II toxin-antitoxin system PemK/MazF family toxin [Candidatus Omnitrophota bacterium]